MKTILVGYGNVGKELKQVLAESHIPVDLIVRSNGIFDPNNSKIDEKENFIKYVDSETYIFISAPSKGNGEEVFQYYTNVLGKNAKIITCEKAFLANHWEYVEKIKGRLKYSATVGGNSGILNAITAYKGEIQEIKAVVNGTLNYIGEKLAEGLDTEEIYSDVIAQGFAEPDSKNIYEIFENELKDVAYKTAILANHSRLFPEIIMPKNIEVQKYKDATRCAVVLNKQGIKAGFIHFKNVSWFPSGANNVLYINGQKAAEGPGAGGRITAERMLEDFKELLAH